MSNTQEHLDLDAQHVAPNYAPLPVVIAEGEGVWVTDVDGKRYLDALAGYSAINFGHRHPDLVAAAHAQLDKITLISRAFMSDQLAPFAASLAELTGKDMMLPMNSGAEAVETGLKTARRWGYEVKGVPEDQATIIVMKGNFHGRTTTIVSFSNDPDARTNYGPYTPGFTMVPYGDLDAVREAVTPTTVAVLVEPIQGEAGVVIPAEGFLKGIREVCTENNILMIADEIQSGLGRTGKLFACDWEDVVPDVYLLGKALGGGIMPLSAVVANSDILKVFTPGSHGSTFGGNPLACAVGTAVVKLLATGEYQQRALEVGKVLDEELGKLQARNIGVVSYRSRGLWAGVDIDPELMTGKQLCKYAMAKGVLLKDTHESTVRIAPPLVVTPDEVRWLVAQLAEVLEEHPKA